MEAQEAAQQKSVEERTKEEEEDLSVAYAARGQTVFSSPTFTHTSVDRLTDSREKPGTVSTGDAPISILVLVSTLVLVPILVWAPI